jgi:hypothetical protein
MDEFLVKPVLAADLWATIAKVTGHGGASVDPLDARALLTASGEDAAVLRSMCEALRARLPEELAALEDAVHDRDAALLQAVAQRIRGIVAAFSPEADDLAARIQSGASRVDRREIILLVEKLVLIGRRLRQRVKWLTLETLRRDAEGERLDASKELRGAANL